MLPDTIKNVTFGAVVTFYFEIEPPDLSNDPTLDYLDKYLTRIRHEILLGYIFEPEHRSEMKKYIDSQQQLAENVE